MLCEVNRHKLLWLKNISVCIASGVQSTATAISIQKLNNFSNTQSMSNSNQRKSQAKFVCTAAHLMLGTLSILFTNILNQTNLSAS